MVKRPVARRGAAALELAFVLPPLAAVFLIAVDFARLYYQYTIVTACARAGAVYGSDPTTATESPYSTLQAAALAEGTDLSPQPSVSSTSGTDADGNPSVRVTVSYSFQTFLPYPGLPQPVSLVSTVQMRVAPATSN
jgi:Flp pilus assembly protein TadG